MSVLLLIAMLLACYVALPIVCMALFGLMLGVLARMFLWVFRLGK